MNAILYTLGVLIGTFWAFVAGAWFLALAGAAFVVWSYEGTTRKERPHA